MIEAINGTPGSGKSYYAVWLIDKWLKSKKVKKVITNIPINTKSDKYRYIDIESLMDANVLLQDAIDIIGEGKPEENSIKLVIDEAQIIFNSRSWRGNTQRGWTKLMQVHRHFGMHIILISQQMDALDKQVRENIEYNTLMRKANNAGFFGWLLGRSGTYFMCIDYWTIINERLGSRMIRYSNKIGGLYDTHQIYKNYVGNNHINSTNSEFTDES